MLFSCGEQYTLSSLLDFSIRKNVIFPSFRPVSPECPEASHFLFGALILRSSPKCHEIESFHTNELRVTREAGKFITLNYSDTLLPKNRMENKFSILDIEEH